MVSLQGDATPRPTNRLAARLSRRTMMTGAVLALGVGVRGTALAAPQGELVWAIHTSLAPTWFDPAETPGIITPFMVLYALHDAMVKPMPEGPLTPSLAESWSISENGLTVEFVLRNGAKFHNGDPVTAEDVKFSFERYRGSAHDLMKARVAAVEALDPGRIRFRLIEPWPDFLTFYSSATGAGWIVPKRYVERVGEAGFKQAPVGAGPYRFVSFTPGVELVLEAFDQFWRKTLSVKRLVFKVIPDEATRVAALKRGEVDIAYSIRGELAEDIRQTPGLTLKPTVGSAPYWVYFPEQWDPKSPWHDVRVRRAASLAINRDNINRALTLGHSHFTGSVMPENLEFFWQPPKPVFDLQKAKQLLAEAGYPNGFDAGEYYCNAAYANLGEAVLNDLQATGIRARLRPLERAAFFRGYTEKKFNKGFIQGASGAFGNAATRLEAFVVKGGAFVYGSYPEIDELFPKQAVELDVNKRRVLLEKMQQLLHEKAVYAPIWQLAFISAVGPRVAESGFGRIKGFVYTAPFEDLTLKENRR
jgi:peptide/nickel transport system substrate-binding protein